MTSHSYDTDLKIETISAKSSRPLWPWVVGAICLTVAGLVFSFWWPMYRAHRVLKQFETVEADYEAAYHHPKWTRFFLDEETFHPWFDELQGVAVYDTPVTEQMLDDLMQFQSLTELGMIIDNTPLEKLKQFELLETLQLFGNVGPDDASESPLSHFYRGEQGSLPQFESGEWERLVDGLHVNTIWFTLLNVHGEKVSNANIKALMFLACEIDETTGEATAGLNALTYLWIHESVAEPAFWEKLSDHPTLTSLTLEESPVSGEGWTALCRIEGLKELEIYFPWDKTKLDYAPDFELLEPPLQPEGSCPIDSDWEYLTGLTNLERLSLRNVQLPEQALRAIAALPNLKELGLENVAVDSSALAELGNSSSLKSLEFWNTSLTADELRGFIETHPHLEVAHDRDDSRVKQLINAP